MESIRVWLDWIEAMPTSVAIRESSYLSTVITVGHVVGMCLFAGLVLMMDLRLAGIGNRDTPFSQIQRQLFPWQLTTMVLTAATGLLLVYQKPTRYYANIFFWIKVIVMILAGVNALAFHRSTYHSIAKWDAASVPPTGPVLIGLASVVLWIMVILTGRLLAYNWFTLR